jgi:O-antigen/teichoic acid export membrane protein
MGIVIRRSGYTAILSYLGFFIGYVNMLWLFPYIFQPEEIGLIRLMIAVSTMFATLASFGGSQVATKFFPYFAETIQRRSAFFKFLCGIAIAGAIIFIAVFTCFHTNIIDIYSKKSPLFITYLWYLIPLTTSLVLYGIIEAFVVVQKYPLVPALLREVYTRALLTIAALAFLATLISFSGFIELVCLLYCISPIILFFYAHNKGLVIFTGTVQDIHRKEINEIAQFGMFAFLGNAGATLLANIDSVVLSAYSGLVSTGIYGIAFFIAVIIEIPKRSLSQVLIPLVVQANKDFDIKTLNVLYKKSSLNQFLIGTAIFLAVWLNIDNLFSLIPNGDIYREGKWVVFLISFAKLFDMLTGINAEIIGTSRYYKIDLLFFSIISIIGISLNFILIPIYGIVGAALAVLLSTVLYNTTRFIFIAVVMKIQPFSKKTLIAMICTLFTFGVLSIVPSFNGTIIDIGLRTILIGIIFGGLVLNLNISEDISQTVRKIVARFNLLHIV